MANAWIEHVKQYAESNGLSYRDALRDAGCKASYHGGIDGGAVGIKKAFKKTKDAFKDAGHYLGDTEKRHYGKNTMKYVNEVNKYTQAVAKPLGAVPIIGMPAKAISGISQAQTNLANNVYRDTKPKEKTYFLDKYDKKGGAVMVDTPLISTVSEDEFYQLSKYNPRRQTGGSFNAMGGSFRAMGR